MASGGNSNEEIDYKSRIWALDQNLDQPIDAEAEKLRNKYEDKKFSRLLLMQLAFQSLGVVYGDLGTSPLYVFYNTFPDGIEDPEDLIGALSLIIYSLTLIPLLKYVLIVCRANDNGQGGTFALYSLLCRHAKVKTIPNQDLTDEQLTTYSRSTFHETSFAGKTKRWLEEHPFRKNALLVLVLVGSSMVIGDGILTPAISVLSAVQGIKLDHPSMSSDVVVLVAVVILVGLFSMQHHGVDRVNQGGWVPLVIALAFFIIMYVWHYGTKKRYEFEVHSKVSMAWILGLGPSLGLVRVPGIGLVYTELARGVPHIFSHFITNLPAIHSIVVFVCVKYLPVHSVPEGERFLVKRIGPVNFRMFRCVVRYGYKDLHKRDESFEKKLLEGLNTFVRLESLMDGCSDSDDYSMCDQETEQPNVLPNHSSNTMPLNMDGTVSSGDSIVSLNGHLHNNTDMGSLSMFVVFNWTSWSINFVPKFVLPLRLSHLKLAKLINQKLKKTEKAGD
ncbi:hypothetical protein OIU78_010030 [Salix suchowensis]|nr:hypothetical protein OIU78_010030 [Salix suchowensis]